MYRPGFKIAMKAACGGGPAGLTGPANLSGRLSAHRFEVVIVLLWLIRASWLIGGTIAHPINRRTRINHNLSGCLTTASHWRIAGHARITSRGPRLPRQGASGHRKAPTPAKAAPGSQGNRYGATTIGCSPPPRSGQGGDRAGWGQHGHLGWDGLRVDQARAGVEHHHLVRLGEPAGCAQLPDGGKAGRAL